MAKRGTAPIGSYAFIGGVLLAVVLGFATSQTWMIGILALLGLVVAVMNIPEKQEQGYLLANVALLIGAGTFSSMLSALAAPIQLGGFAGILQAILANLVFFVAPGAVLLALKDVYNLAQGKQPVAFGFPKPVHTGAQA